MYKEGNFYTLYDNKHEELDETYEPYNDDEVDMDLRFDFYHVILQLQVLLLENISTSNFKDLRQNFYKLTGIHICSENHYTLYCQYIKNFLEDFNIADCRYTSDFRSYLTKDVPLLRVKYKNCMKKVLDIPEYAVLEPATQNQLLKIDRHFGTVYNGYLHALPDIFWIKLLQGCKSDGELIIALNTFIYTIRRLELEIGDEYKSHKGVDEVLESCLETGMGTVEAFGYIESHYKRLISSTRIPKNRLELRDIL